jgi:hypothetical protein
MALDDTARSSEFKPLARTEDLVQSEMDGEVLVYDTRTGACSCLSESAASLFERCDGTRTIDRLAGELDLAPEAVRFGLLDLDRNGLLAAPVPGSDRVGALTRRDFAKRFGVAAAVALPIVTGVVVPTAAGATSHFIICNPASQMNNAQSGCPCMFNADCVPGCNCNPQGTATCCNEIVDVCVPGNTTNLSARGCPCSINANCVPGCNCNPQGTATCCNV